MAEALAENRPSGTDRFLTDPPEVIEYPGGTGAVRFLVDDGRSIRALLGTLLEGNFANTVVELSGCAVTEMPAEDLPHLKGLLGDWHGLQAGSAFIFWSDPAAMSPASLHDD